VNVFQEHQFKGATSRRRNELRPVDWSNTSSLSIIFSIFRNKVHVMVPLSGQQKNQGMILPLKRHSGPRGNDPLTQIYFSISCSSPIHCTRGSKPVFQSSFTDFAAKIIAHISSFPLPVMNPQTVKWASLVAALCWGHPSLVHRYVCPPTWPSFVSLVFEPTSFTNTNISGCSNSYADSCPSAYSSAKLSPAAFLQTGSSCFTAKPAITRELYPSLYISSMLL
jgi:hypothetical protein